LKDGNLVDHMLSKSGVHNGSYTTNNTSVHTVGTTCVKRFWLSHIQKSKQQPKPQTLLCEFDSIKIH